MPENNENWEHADFDSADLDIINLVWDDRRKRMQELRLRHLWRFVLAIVFPGQPSDRLPSIEDTTPE